MGNKPYYLLTIILLILTFSFVSGGEVGDKLFFWLKTLSPYLTTFQDNIPSQPPTAQSSNPQQREPAPSALTQMPSVDFAALDYLIRKRLLFLGFDNDYEFKNAASLLARKGAHMSLYQEDILVSEKSETDENIQIKRSSLESHLIGKMNSVSFSKYYEYAERSGTSKTLRRPVIAIIEDPLKLVHIERLAREEEDEIRLKAEEERIRKEELELKRIEEIRLKAGEEKRRKEDEEAARKKAAAEEAERKRLEDVRLKAEEERIRKEELERKRKEAEEAARMKAAEEEKERKRREDDERKLKEVEERENKRKEAEEAARMKAAEEQKERKGREDEERKRKEAEERENKRKEAARMKAAAEEEERKRLEDARLKALEEARLKGVAEKAEEFAKKEALGLLLERIELERERAQQRQNDGKVLNLADELILVTPNDDAHNLLGINFHLRNPNTDDENTVPDYEWDPYTSLNKSGSRSRPVTPSPQLVSLPLTSLEELQNFADRMNSDIDVYTQLVQSRLLLCSEIKERSALQFKEQIAQAQCEVKEWQAALAEFNSNLKALNSTLSSSQNNIESLSICVAELLEDAQYEFKNIKAFIKKQSQDFEEDLDLLLQERRKLEGELLILSQTKGELKCTKQEAEDEQKKLQEKIHHLRLLSSHQKQEVKEIIVNQLDFMVDQIRILLNPTQAKEMEPPEMEPPEQDGNKIWEVYKEQLLGFAINFENLPDKTTIEEQAEKFLTSLIRLSHEKRKQYYESFSKLLTGYVEHIKYSFDEAVSDFLITYENQRTLDERLSTLLKEIQALNKRIVGKQEDIDQILTEGKQIDQQITEKKAQAQDFQETTDSIMCLTRLENPRDLEGIRTLLTAHNSPSKRALFKNMIELLGTQTILDRTQEEHKAYTSQYAALQQEKKEAKDQFLRAQEELESHKLRHESELMSLQSQMQRHRNDLEGCKQLLEELSNFQEDCRSIYKVYSRSIPANAIETHEQSFYQSIESLKNKFLPRGSMEILHEPYQAWAKKHDTTLHHDPDLELKLHFQPPSDGIYTRGGNIPSAKPRRKSEGCEEGEKFLYG